MPAATQHKHTPKEVVKAVLEGESYATALLMLFVDSVGDELDDEHKPVGYKALHWHPRTVREHLQNHWGVQMTQANFDKLMAAIMIVTTDLFFKNANRFIKLCTVLCGNEFNPHQFEAADALECAWGCTEALLLHPPSEDDPEPFSNEVRHYITHVLKDEGFVTPPDILRIAIDADFSARVGHNFADDPETLGTIQAVQREKSEEVEKAVHGCLLELLGQLKALPLKHGSTADLERRMSNMIRQTERK